MVPGIRVVELPVAYLIFALAGLVFLWLSALRLQHFLFSRQELPEGEKDPDYSIPVIDSQSQKDSPFHCWDQRIKIAALLCFMFCTAFLNHLSWAIPALLLAVCAVAAARIPLRYPLRRLTAMGGFLGMFVLVMPITVPMKNGDTLLVFSYLSFVPFNTRGFFLALLICVKASAIALMAEPLLATASFSSTIQALADLRVPPIICRMLLLAYRYIFVFQQETARMAKGMISRGFRKKTDMATLRIIGNFLGMLLVRSFERTQRVYDAMLSRGYDGTMHGTFEFRACRVDWLKGAFWVLAGIGLIVGDRIIALDILQWF